MACNEFCTYGVAPHTCFYQIPGATLGQSKLKPESEWPECFEPDPDVPGLGVWHDCGWVRTRAQNNGAQIDP